MKMILVLFGVASAPLAIACPDLGGKYSCESGRDVANMEIEQTKTEPVRYYFLEGDMKDRSDYVDADGKTYKTASGKTVKASCEGDVLRVINKGNDPFFGKVDMDTEIYIEQERLIMDRLDKSDLPLGSKKVVCNRR